MKRNVFGVFAAVLVATGLVAAQGQTPSQPQPQPSSPQPSPSTPSRSQPATPDVTLEGCLVQGSGPTVFILENAKTSAQDRSARGMSYVISAAASTNLREHLNHQVRITGASAVAAQPGGESAPRPSAGQSGQSSSDRPSAGQSSPSSGMGQVAKVEEKDMPKLTARTIAKVADTCVAAVPAAD